MAAPAPAAAEQDWEASKENFQPLKTGRKASALRDSTAELRTQAIEAQRRAFWEELAGYSGDDPLEVWLRFIRWTQDTFSSGGHKAELLPLLERCTRELQGNERYRTDKRYLRVWVLYADCLPEPGDVFAFLREHAIGQEHALYHVAFATYLEARGNFARADAVYQQGINRLAAPVERLRAKYAEFQQRMAQRIQRKAQEQSGLDSAEPDHPERKSLGPLANPAGRRSGRAGGGLLGGGLKRKADAENAPSSGGGLDIFVDEEFNGAGGPAASAPAAFLQPGRSAAGSAWNKLTGFEAGRKENMQRPGVWAGQKLKQAAAHSAPAAPALEVFEDPELQEAEPSAAKADAPKPSLRQRLDRGGAGASAAAEEEIVQDPLHLHKAQAHLPPLPGVSGRPEPEAQPAKRRREESMAFDQAALLSASGEELSFEEVRAVAWLQQRAQQLAAAEQAGVAGAAAADDELPDMDLEGDTCAIPQVAGKDAALAAEEAVVEAGSVGQQTGGGEAHSPAAEQAAAESQSAAASAPAAFGSPVFGPPVVGHGSANEGTEGLQHTEQAADSPPSLEAVPPHMEDEQAPGNSGNLLDDRARPVELRPTPFEVQQQEGEERQEHDGQLPAAAPAGLEGHEPTVTLSTKDAFAAINQMFGGSLPEGALSSGQLAAGCGSGAVGSQLQAFEPTMTIATKDAFAALNKMFKGSLPLEHSSLPPNPHAEPTLSLGRGSAMAGSGSGGYEPTMTISTKAAFAAINQMFKGALPGEHGPMPPTARGPAAGYEPTITISTKAAFDAINNMFGGSAATQQQQQQEGGFKVPAPRPPKAQQPAAAPAAAAPAAPDSPAGDGFCIREDTQFVSVPLSNDPSSPAAPSAAAGDGSGAFFIHEDTQFITVPAGSGPDEVEEEEEAPQPGMRHPAAAGSPAGGGLMIREDTQYITVAVQQQDSELLEGEGEEAAAVLRAEREVPGHSGASPAGSGGGFRIREDTQYVGGQALTAAAAGAVAPAHGALGGSSGSFAIREDTQFIGPLDGASAAPSPASSGGSPQTLPAGAAGGSLLPRKRPLGELGLADSTDDLLGGGASPATDTSPAHSTNAGQVSKWGFAPGADDTLALNLDLGNTEALLDAVSLAAAANPAAAQHLRSPGLTDHLQALQLSDTKENLLLAGAAANSGRRSLAEPSVAAAVLQPLGEASVREMSGVEWEADEAAEAQLATAGVPEGEEESFLVYADEDEGSLPLMASPATSGGSQVLDPAAAAADHADGQHAAAPAAPLQQDEGRGYLTPMQQQQPAQELVAVDPFSPSLRDRLLSCLEPCVTQWPGVRCLSSAQEAHAEAGFKQAARGGSQLVELQLCGLEFAVSGVIGEGAYARVYQGVDGDCADVALKVEAPACPWEWYICKALAGRLPAGAAHLFVDPSALLLGERCSVLVAPLGPHGSLQDLINAYLAQQQTPPEVLAMHFAAQLLRIMQHMHAARVLHTDIKPDNLLVTLEHGVAGGDENACPSASLGLQLVDFGRSLDLELLPPGAVLQGDSCTDAFRCVEMREGGPWLWQADAYGVAATVHALLYGQYMEVERVQDTSTGSVSLRPCQPFKRHWAAHLWGPFFSQLLNITDASAPPAVDGLIAAFEEHLASSRDVTRQLRQELSRAAALLPKRI